MAAIRDVLERDPAREIVTVVKVDDHDPERVRTEMEEYVSTEQVRSYFRTFLDRFLETRRGSGENVCAWVSGFFGSGKSHFLKVLGYLLEDRPLTWPGGTTVSSREFLCQKLDLGSMVPILTREFDTRVLYINLVNREPRETVSHLVYQTLLESKGLSTQLWVAQWEEEFQSLGKWQAFLDWVKARWRRPWEQERRLNAYPVLLRALVELIPDKYRDENLSRTALDDSRHRFAEVRPGDVALWLRREAESIHPTRGRIVVLLDEVGLYVGDSADRVGDVDALAEQVVAQGQGKVWLVASAQETLEDLVTRLAADPQLLAWLKDRFRLRFQLTPANIEKVVSERLLKKRPEAAPDLLTIYQNNAGTLTAAASLQGVSRGRLDGSIPPDRFATFYPLAPYSILLLQEIFGALRQRGSYGEDVRRRLAGRERSMLQVVHAVLRGEGDLGAFAGRCVGDLVTMDLLYDAVSSELSIVQSAHHNAIVGRAASVEVSDGLEPGRVAKALFLLQQVSEWLPTSLENIAAVLYPNVAADAHAHREAVRRSLEALRAEGWVAEDQGAYRFLSPSEHDFETQVRAQQPTRAEKEQALWGIVRKSLERFRYEHGQARVTLDVALRVDSQTIREAGDIAAVLYTPLARKDRDAVLAESIQTPDTVFWLAGDIPELERVLERTLSIEKALDLWRGRVLTQDQEQYVERLRVEARTARDTLLPSLVDRAFLSGVVFVEGTEYRPAGESLEAVLLAFVRQVAARTFTEFVDARVRDDDCLKILEWRPGGVLPQVYRDLGLVTATGINPECATAAHMLAEINRRKHQGPGRSGADVIDHFAGKPYGWDHKLVRLVVATLFKNGSISLTSGTQELTDPGHPAAKQLLESVRQFRAAVINPLPPVDWRSARELLVEITGDAVGNTCDEVAVQVGSLATRWRPEAMRLAGRAEDVGLPSAVAQQCRSLAEVLERLDSCSDPNSRLRSFLELANSLRQLVPSFRKLREFEPRLQQYAQMRQFAQQAASWSRELSGEWKQRWDNFRAGLGASDLIERFQGITDLYTILRSAYWQAYWDRHAACARIARDTVASLQQHEAFPNDDEKARRLLAPLQTLDCPGEAKQDHLACPVCGRSYAEINPDIVAQIARRIEAELDARTGDGGPGDDVGEHEWVVAQQNQLEQAVAQVRRFAQKAIQQGHSVEIRVRMASGGCSRQ